MCSEEALPMGRQPDLQPTLFTTKMAQLSHSTGLILGKGASRRRRHRPQDRRGRRCCVDNARLKLRPVARVIRPQ